MLARQKRSYSGKMLRVVWLAVLGVFVPEFGAFAAGDGSGSNNPGLLRGGYSKQCADPVICAVQISKNPQPVAMTTPSRAAQQQVMAPQACRLESANNVDLTLCPPQKFHPIQAQKPPIDHFTTGSVTPPVPELELDWSVTASTSYGNGANGERFEASLQPQISVVHRTNRAEINAGATGTLVKQNRDEFRLSNGALGFDADFNVNRTTRASSGAQFSISQDSPSALGANDDIVTYPIAFAGAADIGIDHQLGRTNVQLRGSLARDVFRDTQLASSGWTSNQYRNRLGLGFGGRVVHRITPVIDVFVDASAERNIYDAVSPSLGVRLDSWTYAVRAGVSGNWQDVLSAEISVGYGLRRFDSALLSDAPTALVDAVLTYRPDPRLSYSALFSTSLLTPDLGQSASTQVDYAVAVSADYQINDGVAVRASFGAQWSRFSGSSDHAQSYTAGVGADFDVNQHTKVSADYVYGLSESSDNGSEDQHTLSLGVTYSR